MTKLNILLTTGTVINIEMPPEFDFQNWVRAVRADGFIIGPKLYISLASVAAVFGEDASFEIKPAGATVQ